MKLDTSKICVGQEIFIPRSVIYFVNSGSVVFEVHNVIKPYSAERMWTFQRMINVPMTQMRIEMLPQRIFPFVIFIASSVWEASISKAN